MVRCPCSVVSCYCRASRTSGSSARMAKSLHSSPILRTSSRAVLWTKRSVTVSSPPRKSTLLTFYVLFLEPREIKNVSTARHQYHYFTFVCIILFRHMGKEESDHLPTEKMRACRLEGHSRADRLRCLSGCVLLLALRQIVSFGTSWEPLFSSVQTFFSYLLIVDFILLIITDYSIPLPFRFRKNRCWMPFIMTIKKVSRRPFARSPVPSLAIARPFSVLLRSSPVSNVVSSFATTPLATSQALLRKVLAR